MSMKHTIFQSLLLTAVMISGCSDSSSGDRAPNKPQVPANPQSGANGTTATPTASPAAIASPTPSVDPVAEVPIDDALASIDSICSNPKKITAILPTVQTALTQTVPATCRSGIEFNDFRRTLQLDVSNSAVGSQTFKMEVDLATYKTPDEVRLVAIDAQGNQQVILSSCRLSTSSTKDPRNEVVRPSSDLIRSFRPVLPKGTRKLLIDFSKAGASSYMKITGLCDFTIPATNVAGTRPTTN
jgi:hypothetical protein